MAIRIAWKCLGLRRTQGSGHQGCGCCQDSCCQGSWEIQICLESGNPLAQPPATL